jgi:2,4-dienoyl-CoA reductase-like NADH-dependent reductase (Old Yellow Enzyme family)/pyruvate/2-oxoglutarate dehydrogenase complex dihydrolipoamide dehydrogenase (E3) component
LFEKLFAPLQIGPLTIPNRIQVTPHELQYLDDGLVSDMMVDYYRERAMGGAGLLEVSQLAIGPAGDWKQDSARRHPIQSIPEIVPGLKRLADAVHPHGSKIFMEVAQWTRVVGPVSGIPFETGVMLDELNQADIQEIQRSYRTAARYVKEAGFDGIDLHGTHGALIEHFYSPAMNRRTDRYGGTIEGRLTFLFELIEMLRSDLGDRMALGMRLCADEKLEEGVTPEYAAKVVQLLDGRLDFINVDSGSSEHFEALNQHALQTQPLYVEKAYGLYMSEPIMKAAGKTKIGIAGRITDPVVAESIIEGGRADYVGMTRALIADPELPRKAREGRLEEIRPCIGTLQDCWGRSVAHEWPMHCTVNPAVGFEGTRGQRARGEVQRVGKRKKILIVGAGVAGLEAARVSSERGHEVVVYEREAEVGGQVNLARLLPGRSDISAILPWYRAQLKKNGVRIETRKGITSSEEARYIVEEERPDAVIVASGSAPIRTGIQMITFREVPGWEGGNVRTIDQVLRGEKLSGDVLVADSTKYILGPGVAEYLARGGARVTLVTPHPHLSPDLSFYNQLIHVFRRLSASGVQIFSLTWVKSIDGGGAVLYEIPTGREWRVGADAVVLNTGREHVGGPGSYFRGLVADTREVGDSNLAGGTIRDAIEGGFEAGSSV